MGSRFKKLIILFLTISLLISSLVACGKKEVEEEIEEEYIPVQVEEINQSSLENSRTFNGQVVANEEVMVIPKMVGIVDSVNVKLGDQVNEGQTLFVIEQDDMNKNIEQSKVSINLAEKGVQQASSAVDTAKINRKTTEENALQSKVDLDRMKILYEEGAIPKSQLEQAELGYLSADSQLQTVDSQIIQSEIALSQAKDQLSQAQISHRQLLDNFQNTIVKAPMTGIVSSLDVKRGQIVTNSQPAAIVVDAKKVYVEIQVIEDMVNNLEIGQEVTLNIPAAFKNPVKSKIEYISSTADISNKLYTVKAYIDNNDNLAKPGMTGDITLSTDNIANTIAVARDSVLTMDGEDFVFIVEDNRAVKRKIEIGSDFGDFLEVKSGLQLGDQVIIKGHQYVDDGSLVKLVGGED